MLSRLIALSIRQRKFVALLLGLLLLGGVAGVRALPIDAIPDVSTIQVSVLAEAPGLSPAQIERMVTFPVELAMNGLPRLVQLRSVSRTGLSVVTCIFEDGTDVWFARQLVLERLRQAENDLPRGMENPQLAPVSAGLGEIYQFVLRSNNHSPMQLRTVLDWEIVPRLRSVPGIIEVNTMGGELKQFQVVVDASKLRSQKLTLRAVEDALRSAHSSIGGGYIERGAEALSILGVGLISNEEDIKNVVVERAPDGTPVLIKHIAHVRVGPALRFGVVTRDGEGEAVTGIAMMLLGANSREVVTAVDRRVEEIKRELPPGIVLDTVYDRSDFVGRTLGTIVANLFEGALVVAIVLTFFLGSLRGAIAAVIGIPASMSIAIFGMLLTGVTGDLMSLGAIDFGFLVDGPIVMLEAVMAAMTGKVLHGRKREAGYILTAQGVAKPVAFAVAIIMLVYLPLLSLEGVEGKMFRPMAITMAFALFGALVYTVIFFPALVYILVPPPKANAGAFFERLSRRYETWLAKALPMRRRLIALSAALLVVALFMLASGGADFVPRIDEGDLVIAIRRAPSIGLTEARNLDLAAERVLKRFPEVKTTVAMTGRAELAYDPVGNENTEILVHLAPKREWTTAHDLDGLSEAIKKAIEREVPSTFVSVSQPIEDRTNELISGSPADVQIQIFGNDLEALRTYSETVRDAIESIPGTGDLRVERVLGLPGVSVTPDRAKLASYGVKLADALSVLEAARVGTFVGQVYEGQRRFDIRVMIPPPSASPEGLGEIYVEASEDRSVPLNEVAEVVESEGPAQIRRENLSRVVRVDVNLRGRDLVSWVTEAQAAVASKLQLPSGYYVTWAGQFENFQRAKARLGIVVPLALAIILGMLMLMFRNWREALGIFAVVPLALIGGIFGLFIRDLPFSISAAVGFIALAGVSVLNGVVITSEVRKRLASGDDIEHALLHGSAHSLRAVLTTAAVAAMGFFPMAIATSAGAEVQRPLATVVIFGIMFSTLMSLFVLPGVLRIVLGDGSHLTLDQAPDYESGGYRDAQNGQ